MTERKNPWVRGKDKSILGGSMIDHESVAQLVDEYRCDYAMAAHCVVHGDWPVRENGEPLMPNLSYMVCPVTVE